MSYPWAALLICLLTAGVLFFSLLAVSLRIYSRAKLYEAFKKLHREERAEKIIEETETLTQACVLLRVIFQLLLVLLTFSILLQKTDSANLLLIGAITFVVTIILLGIVSVGVPHAWTKYASEGILLHSYGLLCLLSFLSRPFLRVMDFNDHLIKRLVGIAETTPEEKHEEQQEEFLDDLEQHRMEGVVDEEQQRMIEGVLELSDKTADEIMTPRTDIVAVEVNSDFQTVVDTIIQAGHTRVPVYEETVDKIVGLVYAKDLLSEFGKDPSAFHLREKMRKAHFVPETKPLRTLLREFQNNNLHIAVLLDEYGGTSGIVTLEDILEELVGEIEDEYEKNSEEPFEQIDENKIHADARTYIDDLNDAFDIELPDEEDYDTVGGFVFSHLGYIPKTGERFQYENLLFTVLDAESRKINRLQIQRVATDTNQNGK